MPKKLVPRDPSGAYRRGAKAKRRIGERRCACGETRPKALIPGSSPVICAACQRTNKGHSVLDDHHPAGAANDPTTVPIPVNDHRAELSVAQEDWPRRTLENPDDSPLIVGAACIRGFADTEAYLIERILLPRAEMLESLETYLTAQLGPKWWIGTEIRAIQAKRKILMAHWEDKSLPIAVRVYPQPAGSPQARKPQKQSSLPDAMLVFDTETRTDAPQCLMFGSFLFVVHGRCMEEGLFYDESLSQQELQILKRYVATHRADTEGSVKTLRLMTRREFLEKFYRDVYKGRCLLVGFNLPFDISRIAYDVTEARGRFAGGFSLGLWSYYDEVGVEHANQFRPRIGIKHIDSKRALKGFTARNSPDPEDLIPEESISGEPEQGYKFRGHFLDLRTLAFALTDRGYSLESACDMFGVEHGKQRTAHHGRVTEEYVDYNRRDVLATSELADKLLEEYAKHPIALQATKAYSPASIGKAYLHAMGIEPVLERQPSFPKEYLGYSETAFFGGRASAHIRKVPLPVVYNDFLSMYPTVNTLMGLWRFVTAQEIRIVEHCQAEIESFLRGLKPDHLFQPETWKQLTGFVQIIPDGDILPSRAKYNLGTNDWQVAVNHLYADTTNTTKALWYSLPDIVASLLLTGRIPKIIDAFRIEPHGSLPELKTTHLRGRIQVDPREKDFFKVVIEERKRLPSLNDISENEKARLDKALKVLANAASYGIYAEMNRLESEKAVEVKCHGIDTEPFICKVSHPDVPGEYCFPPLASLTTGGARLMLALLEYKVTELGSTYAMEDTDSMAIVATENGGLIPCQGGPHRNVDGQEAVRALSWEQVRQIRAGFESLNPYDPEAKTGPILKIEDDNFDPATGNQRQLYCVAISAKRYALFLKDKNHEPVLLRRDINNKSNRWSEHGLGHLLNPTDPKSEQDDWIAQAWLRIIRRTFSLPTKTYSFEHLPAVGRVSVSSPVILRALDNFNEGKKYCDQIKPSNFLLTCHVKQLGHPAGVDPEHFHLIAQFNTIPREWSEMFWIDQYSGKPYRITTEGHCISRQTARVKTYGEVLQEYEFHAESKCADSDGKPCGKQSIGLLHRRHIRIDQIRYIGKESNRLADVESGTVHSSQSVYTEYADPRRDEWETKIVPALRRISLSTLEQESGLSRRMLIDARTGRRKPHHKNQELLSAIARKLTLL